MNRLRETLVRSHVGAVCIAVLLLWCLDSAFRSMVDPIWRGLTFLGTAVAILDTPYIGASNRMDRVMLELTFMYLVQCLFCLLAAVLLSRWIYGTGPIRALRQHWTKLIGGS